MNNTIITGNYGDIPSAQSNTGVYFYAIDQGKYYLADGDIWIHSTPPNIGECGFNNSNLGFNLPAYDQINLYNYTGASPGNIDYLLKGNTVASMVLTWSGANLSSIQRVG